MKQEDVVRFTDAYHNILQHTT